jgi:hypothetical protein
MKPILILILLIATGLIAACSGATPAPATPTNAPSPTIAPAPTQAPSQPTAAPTSALSGGTTTNIQPPPGKPADIVRKASLTAFDANSMRAQTLVEGAGGDTLTLTVDFIKPDRVHVVQSTPTGGSERIAIKGKGLWVKTGDNWDAQGMAAADQFFASIDSKALAESLKVIQDDSIQFLGGEVLENIPTFVYTYKIVVDYGGKKTSGDGKIWIGVADGRAYKAQSVSNSLATPGKQDRTTVLYEYDLPITIEAPQ